MATLTIDVPDDLAETIAALPDKNRAAYLADVNAFALATAKARFSTVSDAAETIKMDSKPVDKTFIAELCAADAEAATNGNAGTMTLEELQQQMKADGGPGFVARLRAQLTAEGLTASEVVGAARAK